MYIPAHFAEQREEALLDLVHAHPLATLMLARDSDLVANHVPLLHLPSAGSPGVLRGHVARANPLWRELADGAPALAIFHAADAYISPAFYPSKAATGMVVPTWNYAVVHVHGRLRAIDDAAWVGQLVTRLTDWQEGRRAEPWAVSDAPAAFVEAQLRAIVGIELAIARMEGKFKLSQNRSLADRAGVVAGLTASNASDALAVAALMGEAEARSPAR